MKEEIQVVVCKPNTAKQADLLNNYRLTSVLLVQIHSELTLTALVIQSRHGPHRKHNSIVDDVTALHSTVR